MQVAVMQCCQYYKRMAAVVFKFVNNYLADLFWYQLIRPYLCRPLLKKEQVLRKNHHSFL